MMLRQFAAKLDKRNWQDRIEWGRTGSPSSSCSDLAFYEDDACFIRYRKRGNGPAIVFLSDGPATLELYDDLIATLASNFTVIAFEAPGNGFSVPKPAYSFDFRPSNDVIARFLRAVAGEQAILAFSCGGAFAAVDIAARYPELCRQLMIIQAPSWNEAMRWKQRRDPRGLISMPFVGQLLFPKMMKSRAPAWYELSMAKTDKVEHFCRCTEHAFSEGATFSLPTLFQNYLTGETEPFDIPEIPAMALWGLRDGSHNETDKQSSGKLAGNVEIVTLDHVGHFPELEDPIGFSALALQFSSQGR